jgi:hypothetical protein
MRSLFTSLLVLVTFCSVGQLRIDVSTLGAAGSGSSDNAPFIQQAIDSVTHNGGGEVIINGGTYMSSTIILKSDVTLRVTAGTTLKAMPNYSAFVDIPYNTRSWMDTYTDRSLIFAEDANNIRITGGGTIDGNGTQVGYLSVSVKSRPFGLRFHGVDTLQIDSITLRQAPQWMASIDSCQNLHIFNTTVYNQCFGSNDGLDISCCVNVLVENCSFDTNDDPLPIKTEGRSICRDVMVRNCTMATFERAVKVGNEALGPLVNIHFQDITVVPSSNTVVGALEAPYNVMYIAVADGGSMDSIYFERINVQARSKTSIFIRLCNRGNTYDSVHTPVQYLRNVWLNDITATQDSTTPNSITGLPGFPVENINLHNVVLTVPGGGPAGDTAISEQAATRPEYNIWGDFLPAYGFFVRHANGVHFDSVCVLLQSYDQRPQYYFSDTGNITLVNPCSGPDVNGVNDLKTSERLSYYPNPANDILIVSNVPAACETFILYDMTGAVALITPSLHRSTLHMNISSLSAGVYTAVALGDNYREVRKVVVTR